MEVSFIILPNVYTIPVLIYLLVTWNSVDVDVSIHNNISFLKWESRTWVTWLTLDYNWDEWIIAQQFETKLYKIFSFKAILT